MIDLWQAIYDTPFATTIRESEVVFPVIESVHVLSLALMAGTIAVVDLRVLGVVLRHTPAVRVERQITPLTWLGFAVMAASGALLFIAEAADLKHNPAFLTKVALLILAGVNMAIFQWHSRPRLAGLGAASRAPLAARLGAAASLALWACVIVAGRAIAYFHPH